MNKIDLILLSGGYNKKGDIYTNDKFDIHFMKNRFMTNINGKTIVTEYINEMCLFKHINSINRNMEV
ncbi:MAG: hypothetical protein ACRCXT_05775 [Paraclostridium sp.]